MKIFDVAPLRTTAQSSLRLASPLVGEPLAKREGVRSCQGLSDPERQHRRCRRESRLDLDRAHRAGLGGVHRLGHCLGGDLT